MARKKKSPEGAEQERSAISSKPLARAKSSQERASARWEKMKLARRARIVAAYAWKHGLSANAIVRKLGLPSDATHLTQVRRALVWAHGKLLRLKPNPVRRLRQEIEDRVNTGRSRPIEFHVIDDDGAPPLATVPIHAAKVLSRLIIKAAREKRKLLGDRFPKEFDPNDPGMRAVIANAGGRTVWETVKALRQRSVWSGCSDEEADELRQILLFVGGNAAYPVKQFDWSANFLSVTLAQAFSANHFALTASPSENDLNQYRMWIDETAVFACGVGERKHGLLARYFKDREWSVPDRAIGDVAFNLIDAHGDEVTFTDSQGNPLPDAEKKQKFLRDVNPVLNTAKLVRIAVNKRVLIVLDGEQPTMKADVGYAALRAGYATDVVVGTRLCRRIRDKFPRQPSKQSRSTTG